MRTLKLGNKGPEVPVIAVGCMRFNSMKKEQASSYIQKCLELGINFFDHADIYGKGACEEIFAQALPKSADVREKIWIQSKCGICPGIMYDFSKEHILASVDGILKRLRTDYLDVLVLHRPDALMEPEEVAGAFDQLEQSGKARNFGVSNHKPSQIALLKKYVKQDILVNQLQLSIPFSGMIANGLEVNMLTDGSVDRDGSALDYCRLHDITIQAWSPFQSGNGDGIFIGNENYARLNQVLKEIGEKYGVSETCVSSAWILRHPASIQLIAGTTNENRLEEIAAAAEITLTREEWYRIYLAAGRILP